MAGDHCGVVRQPVLKAARSLLSVSGIHESHNDAGTVDVATFCFPGMGRTRTSSRPKCVETKGRALPPNESANGRLLLASPRQKVQNLFASV